MSFLRRKQEPVESESESEESVYDEPLDFGARHEFYDRAPTQKFNDFSASEFSLKDARRKASEAAEALERKAKAARDKAIQKMKDAREKRRAKEEEKARKRMEEIDALAKQYPKVKEAADALKVAIAEETAAEMALAEEKDEDQELADALKDDKRPRPRRRRMPPQKSR